MGRPRSLKSSRDICGNSSSVTFSALNLSTYSCSPNCSRNASMHPFETARLDEYGDVSFSLEVRCAVLGTSSSIMIAMEHQTCGFLAEVPPCTWITVLKTSLSRSPCENHLTTIGTFVLGSLLMLSVWLLFSKMGCGSPTQCYRLSGLNSLDILL